MIRYTLGFFNDNPAILTTIAIFIPILLFIVGSLIKYFTDERQKLKKKLRKVDKLIEKRDEVNARILVSQVISEAEDCGCKNIASKGYEKRAKILISINNVSLDKILADVEEAINKNRNNGDAYIARGKIHSLTGKHEEALCDFNEALNRLDTKGRKEAFLHRGIEYHLIGNYDFAIEDFNSALEEKTEHRFQRRNTKATILFHRSFAHLFKGGSNNAIVDITRLLRIFGLRKTLKVNALNLRGVWYYAKNEYDQAIKDYNRALKLVPNSVQILLNRCAAYAEKGEHDIAIVDYSHILTMTKNTFIDAMHNRSIAHYEEGKYGHDIDNLVTILVFITKTFPRALSNRGAHK